MSFIKKATDWFRNFRIVDAMIFEIYLFTVAIVLAKLVPAVLSLNIWLYAIVLLIWLSIILPSIFKKRLKDKSCMDNYRQLSIWKIWIYKVSVMVAWLLILKLIPAMLLLNIVWYVAIACFGLGYLIALIFRKK